MTDSLHIVLLTMRDAALHALLRTSPMSLRQFGVIVALACAAREVPAQLTPRFSGSLLAGPMSTQGGEFRQTDGLMLDAEGTVRLIARQYVAVIGTLSYAGQTGTGDVIAICTFSARFGCRPASADFYGFAGRVGIEGSLGGFMMLQATIGAGWYRYNHSSAPGLDTGAHVVPIGIEAILPLLPHVSVVARGERVHFRDFMGDPFNTTAVLFGLRIH